MSNHRSYSATVRLWLDTEHGRIPVAKVGPDFIVAKSPGDRPEIVSGRLFVEVDGVADTIRIRLPGGVKHSEVRTPIANFE